MSLGKAIIGGVAALVVGGLIYGMARSHDHQVQAETSLGNLKLDEYSRTKSPATAQEIKAIRVKLIEFRDNYTELGGNDRMRLERFLEDSKFAEDLPLAPAPSPLPN